MSELEETKKMKVVQLHYETYLNPKISPLGPQKVKKNYSKIKSKSKVRIERNIENESCLTT